MEYSNIKEEILFVPSGEIVVITLYNLGVILGSDKSHHVPSNEKINMKHIDGYWTIQDSKRDDFVRVMNWSGMNQ